jgi:hypothetical protein
MIAIKVLVFLSGRRKKLLDPIRMRYSDMCGFTFKPSIRINLYFCLEGLIKERTIY